MNNKIEINKRVIGAQYRPYVIAEMSANHNGEIGQAFRIIDMAKSSGADAVKIQTYRADSITLQSDKDDFKINHGIWAGKTLYDLYKEAQTPWDWHEELFRYARKIGITLFSSPFDNAAVDLLEDLNSPAYKIASFEAVDIPLIKYVASTGKPMVISTGMADQEEIMEATAAARDGGCKQLALLHCVSAYPASAEDYNLHTIKHMSDNFDCVVGLSDHTINNATAVASVAMGASIIEKHVTMDREGGGVDDSFSLEPNELVSLCRDVNIAATALGKVCYDRCQPEEDNLVFRRSIYAIKDIEIGEKFDEGNIRCIRPGFGLKPKYYHSILGAVSNQNIERGTAIRLDHFE